MKNNGVRIFITGDFYAGNRTEELIFKGFLNDIFNDLLPLIRRSDIAVTNLESPLTDSDLAIQKTGPAIKANPKAIEALKFAGFNLLTLANNHIMDYGFRGLKDTLELCENNNIDYCGVGKNLESASKVYYKEINATIIAFINLTENEFSTTNGDEPGTNPLDPVLNYYSIKEAKGNADFVFVIIHGGHEMYNLPSPRMKKTYRFFIDSGADIVIGHHPHCFSGFERYNGGIIFYSLGNFVFDSTDDKNINWYFGFAVNFIIANNRLTHEIIPIEQSKFKPGVRILRKKENENFYHSIEALNSIIADDKLLSEKFEQFSIKSFPIYNHFLQPYSSKFLHILRRKGYLRSILGRKKRLLYLNLIRCESHRDMLIKTLMK
ncbi:MAG: CapA family protein [Bacteroidota bacterium]